DRGPGRGCGPWRAVATVSGLVHRASPPDMPELGFDLLPADLRVAGRRLDGRGPLLGDVAQVVRHLLQAPTGLARPMREVMAQIMEGGGGDERPLGRGGLGLEGAEPVVDAGLAQALLPLGGEDIGALGVTSAVLGVGGQRLAHLIEQVNVAGLAALVTDVDLTRLGANVRVLQTQPRDIADPTAGPVAQREEGGS